MSAIKTERYLEQRRKYSRQFRAKNPEAVKECKRSYYQRHREEIIQKVKTWQDNNRERKWAWNRNRRLAQYGLDLARYLQMLEDQNHCCAICGKTFTSRRCTHVDHDHTTGKARAILCSVCNKALGCVEKDSGEWLTKALAYLEFYKRRDEISTGQ